MLCKCHLFRHVFHSVVKRRVTELRLTIITGWASCLLWYTLLIYIPLSIQYIRPQRCDSQAEGKQGEHTQCLLFALHCITRPLHCWFCYDDTDTLQASHLLLVVEINDAPLQGWRAHVVLSQHNNVLHRQLGCLKATVF
jgi:hypothetical protein